MIELPTNFATNLTAKATEQISNFSDVLLIVIGLLLTVMAIGALINMIKK